MPIYEYVCGACGQTSEILQKISDPDERKCPVCGKLKLKRQVSAAGFRLKGACWYETDFKSDNKKNLAGESATSGSGAGDGAAVTGKESKPKPAAKSKPAKKAKAASN